MYETFFLVSLPANSGEDLKSCSKEEKKRGREREKVKRVR